MNEESGKARETRCGFAALVARRTPASRRCQSAVGAKCPIVSRQGADDPRAGAGIAICGDAQIVLVDTAGIFAPNAG